MISSYDVNIVRTERLDTRGVLIVEVLHLSVCRCIMRSMASNDINSDMAGEGYVHDAVRNYLMLNVAPLSPWGEKKADTEDASIFGGRE